jgi:hypothetical protein
MRWKATIRTERRNNGIVAMVPWFDKTWKPGDFERVD